jgi:hypothetical protein
MNQSTISILRPCCVSTPDEASLVSRFVYRPISFYLTVPFVWLGCSANAVTLLRIPTATIAAVLVATGLWSLTLAGSVLHALGTFLDYVDGNLARFNKSASVTGELLDGITHIFELSVLPIGIAVGLCFRADRLLRFHHVNSFLLLSFGFVASAISFSRTSLPVLNCFTKLSSGEVKSHKSCAVEINGRRGTSPVKWIKHTIRIVLVEGAYTLGTAGIILFAVADLMTLCLLGLCVVNAFRLRDESRTLRTLFNTSANSTRVRNSP